MSFVKRSDAAPVCYSKPLDSVKNWNDHFFWVDSTAFPLFVSLKSKILSKDPLPKLLDMMQRRADRGRNPADREVGLLKMTEGRTVLLNPLVTAASGDSGDSIDTMFDKGNDVNQEHSVGKYDDVLEEVVDLDASKSLSALRGMIPEGSAIPSDATEPLVTVFVTPMSDVSLMDSVSGLNLRTRPPHVRCVFSSDSSHHSGSYSEIVSLVRSDADVPVVTVAVTTTVDANVATGLKAKDAPKDFEHIGDYVSSGGVDEDAAIISKLKKPSISSDSFYVSQSLDTEAMHRLRAIDYDQLYSEFNVEAARQMCLRVEVRMRAEHTLERKGKLEDRCAEQATFLSKKDVKITYLRCLLSLKEAKAVESISLHGQLSVVEAANAAKGTEFRDLKEKNFALEGEKNILSERVKALESVAASKEVELASLSSQVVNLTADLSGFQLSHDELNSKVASLESKRDYLATQKNSPESAFEFFKEQVEKMQDEQVGVLSDPGRRWILSRGLRLVLAKCLSSPEYLFAMGEAIGRAINKGMQDGLAVGIEHGIAGRSITDVTAFNPSIESDYIAAINALQGVSFSLLSQLEANKYASMADIMDLLRLEGPAAKTSEASQLQPSLDQLIIPIYRLGGDATARLLFLMDSILPSVEPFSARNLTGEASSSVDFTTTVTTALSTTFIQTYPVPAALCTEVPPSPKVVFEEK
uniref:Transposase (Putative), gypsy type n=1 Tax=Tanacetum cinerariifolium TaxID=118510 RepID=A0A699HBM6_TANCI|nr:hypothetical protein [Tanacetum cinerariifolium]